MISGMKRIMIMTFEERVRETVGNRGPQFTSEPAYEDAVTHVIDRMSNSEFLSLISLMMDEHLDGRS